MEIEIWWGSIWQKRYLLFQIYVIPGYSDRKMHNAVISIAPYNGIMQFVIKNITDNFAKLEK